MEMDPATCSRQMWEIETPFMFKVVQSLSLPPPFSVCLSVCPSLSLSLPCTRVPHTHISKASMHYTEAPSEPTAESRDDPRLEWSRRWWWSARPTGTRWNGGGASGENSTDLQPPGQGVPSARPRRSAASRGHHVTGTRVVPTRLQSRAEGTRSSAKACESHRGRRAACQRRIREDWRRRRSRFLIISVELQGEW